MANKNTGIYGHFGTFSSTAQLPNVVGADVQTSELSVGDLASVAGALYICTAATPGAGVWAAVAPPAAPSSYAASGTWTPVVTGPQAWENVAPATWTRIGPPGSTGPAVGDIARVCLRVFGTVAAGGSASIAINNLPLALGNSQYIATVVSNSFPDQYVDWTTSYGTPTNIQTEAGPFTLETGMGVSITLDYPVAA